MKGIANELFPWEDKLRRARNGCWVWTGYVDRFGYGKQATYWRENG